jgi:hypothetical protein
MAEENQKAEPGDGKAWPFVMSWVGRTTALIGLFASVGGGITWVIHHHQQTTERQAKMALAEAQAKQGEYQASVQSYGDILKAEPLNRPALDGQLTTTMGWVEDFHIPVQEGQSAAELAAPALDEILSILDAGLTRSKGTQAADVQAHIGWAHWLNQHIAEREFGPATEQNLRAALTTDPQNVYANAMLGNWILQNHGNFSEAIERLNTAVSTGKVRPFVRRLQIGGLIYLDKSGTRAELVRAADGMRKAGEPLSEDDKRRILGFCFDPFIAHHGELAESLSAVPPDDAWQTYLWLDDNSGAGRGHALVHEFVNANLLEVAGKRQESLAKYRALQLELKNQPGSMQNSVNAAIARLSAG